MSSEATAPDAPANANVGCVGPTSKEAGKQSACHGCPNQSACASGAFNSPEAQAKAEKQASALQQSLHNVSNVVLVLSGKGGVGKSTVAAQLGHALAAQGYAVGVLDVDLCGPSAPRMVLGDASLSSNVTKTASGAWTPVVAPHSPNLSCMSIAFLLGDPDAAVVWRGPRKNGLIEQFLSQTDWTGDTDGLDYLLVDTPPGTSDEHLSTVQYLQQADAVKGAIVVTTPEEVSLADVRKELNFCKKTNVPVLGVIENMSRYETSLQDLKFRSGDDDRTDEVLDRIRQACPEVLDMVVSADVFGASASSRTRAMAERYLAPYWGQMPLDTKLLQCCERGEAFVTKHPDQAAAKALNEFATKLTKLLPVEEVEEDDDGKK